MNAKGTYEERQENLRLLPYKKIIIGTESIARGLRISHASICFVYDSQISSTSYNTEVIKFDL